MDNIDAVHESVEHARKPHEAHAADPWNLRSAMVIAVFAACGVIAEMSANDAQTAYLGLNIAASDTWTQYQAKSVRRTIYLQSAATLQALHAGQAVIAAARAQAERMSNEPGHDGMQQLALRARADEENRDHELHLRDGYERGVRGLQIAVVLTSLFIATRIRLLVFAAALLGALAAGSSLLVALGKL
jgi:hypothetical protein